MPKRLWRELTIRQFSALWAEKAGIEPDKAHDLLFSLAETVLEALANGKAVRFPNLAIFDICAKPPREWNKNYDNVNVPEPYTNFSKVSARWTPYVILMQTVIDKTRMKLGIPTERDFELYKKFRRKGDSSRGKKKDDPRFKNRSDDND